MRKEKILFIDRDGTIIREPANDFQVDSLEKFAFVPGAIGALRRLAEETDYRLVLVSNQDGLGTSAFPEEAFQPLQNLMLRTLAGENVVFDEVLIDRSFPEENSPFRKPRTGMVEKYLNKWLDRENSYVIGDRVTDMQLATNMDIRGIYLGSAYTGPEPVALSCATWQEALAFLTAGSRRSQAVRKSTETSVEVEVDLNGTGKADVHTGLFFFDHMLEQIARHGGVNLTVRAAGDLQVDEHHTIEDTGLVFGECFRSALGSKKGIERYGFALPMDEARAEVLLDLGGRACLCWEVSLQREYVGDFPTEMARHFFDSFCQACKCNLHVRASGENAHHILEGVFKAFARSLKQAVRQSGGELPSSKGMFD